jgi:thiamine biosynthesis lipoprotein
VTAPSYVRSIPVMGTIATIEVVDSRSCQEPVERALEWFRQIEQRCSRFEPGSELMQLSAQIGVAVPVSPIVFEAVRFALGVAEETGGAFDLTVGRHMEAAGFNREYQTGRLVQTALDTDLSVNYRDVRLNPEEKAITLLRPMILDLGAVAKGLAVDMAARELQECEDFAIDAGGDLYLAGCNSEGRPWSVGIRHPRLNGEIIDSIQVSNQAVCTSGDYERGNHIINPIKQGMAAAVASVTVVAHSAMLADAVATAAFVLGPDEGIRLFERLAVDGLIISSILERFATRGMFGG